MTGDADTDADAVIARVRDRAETVRDREVDRALARLDARDRPAEREAVEALADRLVERLLAVPVATLREADEETVETALDLFG